MGDIDRVQVMKYEGTIESAKDVLEKLNVVDKFYHFDVNDGSLILHKRGLMLRPGDYYHYVLPPEPIDAIG